MATSVPRSEVRHLKVDVSLASLFVETVLRSADSNVGYESACTRRKITNSHAENTL